MMPYERLKAWHSSHQFVLAVYRATSAWPSDERFGLISQARRAVVSVSANLAEGAARRGGKELRRFADIALGSLSEVSCLLRIAKDLDYLPAEKWKELETLRNDAGRLIFGLARAMTKRGEGMPG